MTSSRMTTPIPAAVLAHHTAILGKTGSGKSYAAKGAIEGMLARGERVCVVDPTGVYWGLRLAVDGRKPSRFKPLILGGRHADLPLPADAGARVAAIVASSTTPVILDTQQMTTGQRTRFFTAFAEALLRENRGPLNLVVDEAHLFAPQGAATGGFESTALLHATNNLVSLGRSSGLRITVISQRAAKLHKDTLTQVETLIVLRVIAPQDQKAIKGWIDGAPDQARGAEIMASLSSLGVGEGWIYAPEQGVLERMSFPAIATFDSGRPLEAGEAPVLAPIDVEAVRAAMSEPTPAPVNVAAAAPARRPSEASAAPARPASAEEIAAAEQRGYGRGVEDGEADGEARGRAAGIKAAAAHVRQFKLSWRAPAGLRSAVLERADTHPVGEIFADAILEMIDEHDGPLASQPEVLPARTSAMHQKQIATDRAPAPVAARHTAPDHKLGAERRILAVLVNAHPAAMSEAQWAVAAGMKRSGGTWSTYKSRLRSCGAVERSGALWAATRLGMTLAGIVEAPMPPPGPELVDFWAQRISGVGPMLRALAARYPKAVTRADLASTLGMVASGGTFGTYLSRLSGAGLIEKSADGVRAAPALMEGDLS